MKYLLLATCLMALNFCNGQQRDTIRVEMLVTDTSHFIEKEAVVLFCKDVKCPISDHWYNHDHYRDTLIDRGRNLTYAFSIQGYMVRWKYIGNQLSYGSLQEYNPSYFDTYYLTKDQKPIPTGFVVWQAKQIKNVQK